MRKEFLSFVGALAVAAFTVQLAIAAPHRAHKAGHSAAARQFRNAFGSKPNADDGKSCDVIWCYEN